jgi:hypothetical protein
VGSSHDRDVGGNKKRRKQRENQKRFDRIKTINQDPSERC